MSQEQMTIELERLRKENEALKSGAKPVKSGIKVSPKGCVAVYGLGRFPVVLYAGQWEALFNRSADIKKFIEENKASLAFKPVKE